MWTPCWTEALLALIPFMHITPSCPTPWQNDVTRGTTLTDRRMVCTDATRGCATTRAQRAARTAAFRYNTMHRTRALLGWVAGAQLDGYTLTCTRNNTAGAVHSYSSACCQLDAAHNSRTSCYNRMGSSWKRVACLAKHARCKLNGAAKPRGETTSSSSPPPHTSAQQQTPTLCTSQPMLV